MIGDILKLQNKIPFIKTVDISQHFTGNNNWVTSRATAIIFQDISGTWYMLLQIGGTSNAVVSLTLTFTGITFDVNPSGAGYQGIGAASFSNDAAGCGVGSATTLNSYASGTATTWGFGGIVRLAGKPDWI